MTSTLLISTYNWPEALKLVLESVFTQTVLPDEIIVADDGSRSDTKVLIDEMRGKSPIPINHVWHEDIGFRLASIRNKALAQASGDYILQIDGDCILPRHYVEDHLRMATPGYYMGAKRIMLTKDWSEKTFQMGHLFIPYISMLFEPNGLKHFLRLLRLPILMKWYSLFRSLRNQKKRKIIYGCNMGYWKSDFLMVNGYNEDFIGWGHEESEMLARFDANGIRKCVIYHGAVVYHLYHETRAKGSSEQRRNWDFMQETIKLKRKRTVNGVDKYL